MSKWLTAADWPQLQAMYANDPAYLAYVVSMHPAELAAVSRQTKPAGG